MIMSPLTKASLAILVLVAVAAIAPRGVFAQTSDVTCLSSFTWMDNGRGQNPCLVAAYLQGTCNGGQFEMNSLPANNYYIGPTVAEANACECSTVTYSLVSACGDCQNRTFVTWSSWSYNCSTIYNSTFSMDIPSGTAVPNWAYLNVVTSDLFNVAAAQSAGDTPESTASKAQSTGTVATSSTSALPSSTSMVSPTGSHSNIGAIVGGVVGGIIAAIAGVAAWFFMKRRRSTTAPSAVFSDIGGDPGYSQSVYSANPNSLPVQSEMAQQPRRYDPSDPRTFPTSPPSPTLLTNSSNIYEKSSIPSNGYVQQLRAGQYTGVPEI